MTNEDRLCSGQNSEVSVIAAGIAPPSPSPVTKRRMVSVSMDVAKVEAIVAAPKNRAKSHHSGSYPAAANMLTHSAGVMRSTRRPMADHRVSIVRAASLRRSALSLAKAFSIGLKSGL